MTLRFESERVALRAFEPEDAAAVASYLNQPDLAGRRYVTGKISNDAPLALVQIHDLFGLWGREEAAWTLAVTDPRTREVLGHVRAEWGWDPHCPSASVVVASDARRRGLGTAALTLAVEYLFLQTPAHVVSGWASSWNHEAISFARHLGFREAGRCPCGGVRDGRLYDEVAFDLLRREWIAAGRRFHGA
ncbi:MAG: GNAT family protein [Candidatus Bipolaricaulota bacterium]